MTITVDRLTKSYSGCKVLNSFSAEFSVGVNAILGANGAGKSTLAWLITDAITRDSGSIMYCGEEILNMGARFRKVVGFMPQFDCLYEQMTVTDFLRYLAELKGLSRVEGKKQIPELLYSVHLSDTAHRRIGTLSGGMKQRLMFAQSLLGDPEVLILDEPTAGLDPEERVSMREQIQKLGNSRIILISTHIASDVEHIADKIFIMKKGRLLFSGDREELLKQACKDNIEAAYIDTIHRCT